MRAAMIAMSACVACTGGAPTTRMPAVRPQPPADLARIPGDVWAVGAIDLQQLRDGTAWRWLRGLAGEHSLAVLSCAGVFDAASRAIVALQDAERGQTVLAIVDGVDRAALAACLRRPPAEPPDVVGHAECDRYDAAVHELDDCGVIPLSKQAELKRVRAALGDGEPGETCRKAAEVVEAAIARRNSLGWACRQKRGDWAGAGGMVKDVDADTLELPDGAVRFLGDRTVAIAHGARARDAVAELSSSHAARWFDALVAAIDTRAMAWFVADPRKLSARGDKLPSSISGTIELRSGVGLDLRFADVSPESMMEWSGPLTRLSSDPDLAGSTVQTGCVLELPRTRGAQQDACIVALDHEQEVQGGTGNVDTHGFLAERIERCVTDRWPATLLRCLSDASDSVRLSLCYNALPAADRDRITIVKTLCGSHPFQLRITVPQMRIEALKLAKALDAEPRADCRIPSDGAATSVAIGASRFEPDTPYASACFARGDTGLESSCIAVELSHGRSDFRFADVGRCVGPYLAATGAGLRAPGGCPLSLTTVDDGQLPHAPVDDKHVFACRGSDCTPIPLHGRFDAISFDTRSGIAAARFDGAAVEIWNMATHRRTATFRAPAADCTIEVVGASLFETCGQARSLVTTAGKRIAAVGGATPIAAIATSPIWLGGTRWAFVAETGAELVIQDVATGVVERRIALGQSAEPGMVEAAGDGKGAIAIAYGGTGPSAGTLVVVDPAGDVHPYRNELCPP